MRHWVPILAQPPSSCGSPWAVAGLPWLLGWHLWLQHSFIHHTCPENPLHMPDSGLGEEWDSRPLNSWPALSMWWVQTSSRKIEFLLLSFSQRYLAPTRPCTCPLPGASGHSGICRGCLWVASAAMALLILPSGGTATVHKKPSMQPFFLLQPLGWRG